jgi:serine/threonine-protein kinase
VLAGKYRVEKVLGVGGMGVVVAAHHIALDEKVAIKFLLPETLRNAEAVARFMREARAAVKIKSEHVAHVSDVGQLENGAPYMVMEYLQGGDLADWLRQRGPLAIEQAVDFVLQACVAVAEAHALGIVHRDLKPANLFCLLGADGQLAIKVLDFGISKLTNEAAMGDVSSMTKTTAVMGSPFYMSPEQLNSAKMVDSRADIWALGVVLYELIAGRPPFDAPSVMELAIRIANDPPRPLGEYRPDAPPELDATIRKCLEKDRNNRFRNVAELALALLPFGPRRSKARVERISGIIQAAGLSQSALDVPVSPPQADLSAAPVNTMPGLGRTLGPTHTQARSVAVVGGALALLAVGGMLAFRHGSPAKPPETATGSPAMASASPAPAPAPSPEPAPPPADPPAPPLPAPSAAPEERHAHVSSPSAVAPKASAPTPSAVRSAVRSATPSHPAASAPAEPSDPLQRLTPKR